MEDGVSRMGELDQMLTRHQVRLDLAREARVVLDGLAKDAFVAPEAARRGWWPFSRQEASPMSREAEIRKAMTHRMRAADLADRLAVAREGLAGDRARLQEMTALGAAAGSLDAWLRGVAGLEVLLPDTAVVLEGLSHAARALTEVLREAESDLAAAPASSKGGELAALVEGARDRVSRVVRAPGERGAIGPEAIEELSAAFEPVRPVCEAAVRAEQELVAVLKRPRRG